MKNQKTNKTITIFSIILTTISIISVLVVLFIMSDYHFGRFLACIMLMALILPVSLTIWTDLGPEISPLIRSAVKDTILWPYRFFKTCLEKLFWSGNG